MSKSLLPVTGGGGQRHLTTPPPPRASGHLDAQPAHAELTPPSARFCFAGPAVRPLLASTAPWAPPGRRARPLGSEQWPWPSGTRLRVTEPWCQWKAQGRSPAWAQRPPTRQRQPRGASGRGERPDPCWTLGKPRASSRQGRAPRPGAGRCGLAAAVRAPPCGAGLPGWGQDVKGSLWRVVDRDEQWTLCSSRTAPRDPALQARPPTARPRPLPPVTSVPSAPPPLRGRQRFRSRGLAQQPEEGSRAREVSGRGDAPPRRPSL